MLDKLKDMAATLLATLQTRLLLLSNEVQAQKLMLARQLVLVLALVFCLALGVLLAVALVLSVWWEQRVAVLGVSVVVFFLLALGCFAALRRTLTESDALFGASVAALQDDLQLLRTATRRGKADE